MKQLPKCPLCKEPAEIVAFETDTTWGREKLFVGVSCGCDKFHVGRENVRRGTDMLRLLKQLRMEWRAFRWEAIHENNTGTT